MKEIISKIEVFPMKRCTILAREAMNILSNGPVLIRGRYSRRVKRHIEAKILKEEYGLILVYGLTMAPYVEKYIDETFLIDFVDAVSMNLDRARKVQRSLIRRAYNTMNYRKMYLYEQKIKNKCDRAIVSSETDFAWLGFNPEEFSVIPNCVDMEYFYFGRSEAINMKRIVFLGNMEYFPNQEAVWHLVDDILPLIKEKIPDIDLLVLGSNPGRDILRLNERDGIEVTGFVPDIREFLESSALLVAPLKTGSGTKIKKSCKLWPWAYPWYAPHWQTKELWEERKRVCLSLIQQKNFQI